MKAKALLSHFLSISINEVEQLPIREYRFYLNECFNLAGFLLTGKYEFETEKEKITNATEDYYARKKRNKW